MVRLLARSGEISFSASNIIGSGGDHQDSGDNEDISENNDSISKDVGTL